MTRALLTIFCLSSLACVTGPVPRWEGKIWLGRAKQVGIIFTLPDGTNEVIRADDPRFNNFIAMTTDDFKSLVVTYIQGCKTWKPGVAMMSAKSANMRFQILMEDIKSQADQEATK
jgi:hypothetical protein